MAANIFLPGLEAQLAFFTKHVPRAADTLLLGYGAEEIALSLATSGYAPVSLILDNDASLFSSRLKLSGATGVEVKYMDYTSTDFPASSFSAVYAQASVSLPTRHAISKEMLRLLKPGGFYCAGEIIALRPDSPRFMQDIWERSGLSPVTADAAREAFKQAGFTVAEEKNLTHTLKPFYTLGERLLANAGDLLGEEADAAENTLIRLKHEVKAFLKLGGHKFMGFRVFLLRKAAV